MGLAPPAGLRAADVPAVLEPPDGAVTVMGNPHFQWRGAVVANPGAMPSWDIQIATDKDFARLVDEDRIAAVVSRYVPDKELAPGDYRWRVAGVDAQDARGPWLYWYWMNGNVTREGIRIAGNRLERIGGDGIILWCAKGAIVERNFVRQANNNSLKQGHAAIWPYFCEDVVFQYNEGGLDLRVLHPTGRHASTTPDGCRGPVIARLSACTPRPPRPASPCLASL